ncbi:hypothetical protein [Rossellomorea sp. FM04394]|uniref:hypothetical protein n=1 Tax=Rossellomorea sp. FM04394 TaxID=3243076 RepID=UPI0035A5CAD9
MIWKPPLNILFGAGIGSLASLDPALQEYSLQVYVSCEPALNMDLHSWPVIIEGVQNYILG